MASTVTFISIGLTGPKGLAFDSQGNLYCSNYGNNTISKITNAGVVSIFVNRGLNGPNGLAFDSSGNLYCCNNGNNTISKITSTKLVSTFVSSGLNQPQDLAFDNFGNLYCSNYGNNTISKITSAGVVSTFVSSGLNRPQGLAFDSLGNLYCSNILSNSISKITTGGVVSTFVTSLLSNPKGLAFDNFGNLYCSNENNTIIKITSTGVASSFVSSSRLNNPQDLAFDIYGNLYCSNFNNNTITKTTLPKPTIIFSVDAKTFGNAPFTLSARSNSSGAFSYSSSNTSVATISGNTLTIVGEGTSIITANQAATASYSSGDISANFVVNSPTSLWTTRASAGNGSWVNITYGNGLFVAVSTIITYIMTSSDGINWTPRSVPDGIQWNSVTYGYDLSGNGLFVAVGNRGGANLQRVMTSSNGINWITRTAAAANNWRSVTFGYDLSGNGLFVAVSNSGTTNRVMTSYNGITWTTGTTPASFGWTSITYGNDSSGNGLFAAVSSTGTGDRVMISRNGINWTLKTTGASNWNSITNGNGLFVAVSDGNQVITSTNGNDWKLTTIPEIVTWTGITYVNGLFLAVASTGTNRVAISYDGIYWSTDSGIPNNMGWQAVTSGNDSSGNTLLVAVGVGGSQNERVATAYTRKPSLNNFTVSSKNLGDAPFTLTDPSSNSNGSFTYSSSNTSVATILGNTVTIVRGGTSIITATQAPTTNYSLGDISANFVVIGQVPPTITDFTIPTQTYGNIPFQLTAPTSNSTGAFSYTSSDEYVATIEGNIVTIVGPGTSIITATQAATENYTTGDISANLVVNQSTPDNPTYIDNENKLLYFMESNAVYGNIDSSFSINYNIVGLSKKVLLTNNEAAVNITKTS